jgi:hypothetical protein
MYTTSYYGVFMADLYGEEAGNCTNCGTQQSSFPGNSQRQLIGISWTIYCQEESGQYGQVYYTDIVNILLTT